MTPIERISGKIVDIKEGEITIKAKYDNWNNYVKRGYEDVEIELIDSRPLSEQQRRMCWAMVGEIAEWQGERNKGNVHKDLVHEARKVDFLISELGGNCNKMFSLSNAPMSLVSAYQNYLIHFILANDIPTKLPLYKYADDIQDYIYHCLINKKCAVCGKPTELHHVDQVGMGRDRNDIIHEGMKCLPLCGEHHGEAHNMGKMPFMELYHFDDGVVLDKTLCKIYKLKRCD
jgi:hypothetical protein